MSERRCKTCDCFKACPRAVSSYTLSPGFGECRRDQPKDGWPRVHEDDWCGQWCPKVEG